MRDDGRLGQNDEGKRGEGRGEAGAAAERRGLIPSVAVRVAARVQPVL